MQKVLIVLAAAALAGTAVASGGTQKGLDPKKIFEVMKQLQGSWHGESKSGMKEDLETKLIGGGAVLMETSSLNMATMYHLDGSRVLLTHYCEAMNQPRLKAASISPDGKKIVFTFLDGTNMKSRDSGHMDKVVFEFIDKDTYRNKWTWYQNGKERWMEDFTYRRTKPAEKAS